ncbi:MAG: hypothetical protein EDM71_08550 [Proteobacteria bacterium]|nr:MAG: hypothetical protein EDM71_08550 [Pseudomonadota bacterium]MBC6944045.1 hypothetical protein [Gammaproteobacteria bacterium]MCL4776016.1 TonB-dependent receptor [Gammaproteobacteria bacterium]MDL1880363.1 hypothetical protein [Gammaproteobacteria bacterium PRO2]
MLNVRGLVSAPALLAAAVTMAMPGAAWSQIEEIVVTTRKKEENLQDVPIAVSAITADQIERQGVADLSDVVKSSPSVQFDRAFGPSDTRITIRGLSNTRGRSNVAFLVDNIDVTTENLISAGSGLLANRRLLSDVERIEIVKGPQSALYGRAAFAGAINYITRDPGDEFNGSARLDFAQDGFQQVDAAFGGPVTDTLGLRMTGFWYSQGGHYVNAMSGQDVGDSSGSGTALTVVWRPDDITRVKLRGEYSREDYGPMANARVGGGWQEGGSNRLMPYPGAMLQHAQNMFAVRAAQPNNDDVLLNGLGFTKSGSNGSTALLDFNQYCPDSLKDPSQGPGFCQPTSMGNGKGRVVKQSENPLTGQDFDGSDLETFRLSIIASFDLDGGRLSSFTGWTNFNGRDSFDQDWQAEADYKFTPPGGMQASYPATPAPGAYYNGRRPDQLLASQIASTESGVDQLSQELRFESRLDGPWQYTIGALYWDEKRTLDDSNGLYLCMPLDKEGRLESNGSGGFSYPTFGYQAGVCDGTNNTVIGWQQEYLNTLPMPVSYWEADTRHWSFYGNIDWQITDDWQLVLEDRLVSERFRLLKPNQVGCTNLGYLGVIGQVFLDEQASGTNVICAKEKVIIGNNLTSNDSYRTMEASTSSNYHTPKVTLNWKPTPDNLLYFFWAKAQKPGGINQLVSGGVASTVTAERYDPEELQAWEIGSKNTTSFYGPLQANISGFFQDYTDKQITTQVVENGIATPRVLNASGAEIWGLELELQWQPDFAEGLALTAAYTYLDAKYTKFVDNVTSLQRIAQAYSAGRDCTLVYLDNPTVPDGHTVDPATFQAIGSVACQIDYDGAWLERTPEHALALGASYKRPLTDDGIDLLTELSATWQSRRYLDQDNAVWFDPYWNVDARVGLIHPRYEIIAYIDNLLDDDTIRSGGSGPDFGRQVSETGFTGGLGVIHYWGTLPDPRIFGIRATYRFGLQ